MVAKADRLGLPCEATLDVSWMDETGGERVRVVAHRQDDTGEPAVLVHESAAPGRTSRSRPRRDRSRARDPS